MWYNTSFSFKRINKYKIENTEYADQQVYNSGKFWSITSHSLYRWNINNNCYPHLYFTRINISGSKTTERNK